MRKTIQTLFLLVAMVDLSVYAFTPPGEPRQKLALSAKDGLLIPSNVYIGLKATSTRLANVHDIHADNELQCNDAPNGTPADRTVSQFQRKRVQRHKKLKRYGNLPDVHWRAISMEHLRMHPQFDALPEFVDTLNNLEDVRNFRQDSWQWEALHAGRCTTSQVSAALGFLEPQAAKALQIPKSWQRGGLGAYYRLSDNALRTLEEIREALIMNANWKNAQGSFSTKATQGSRPREQLWREPPSPVYPFAAKYVGRVTPEERQRRKSHAVGTSATSVKMMWGSAQEATSLLTALNYFSRSDPDVRLEEVGMCGAGLPQNSTFLLGASPDALICHSNGTKEVLEVKNHCPFYSNKIKKASDKNFAIKSFPFSEPYLQPLHVPQLMMEMFCTGCQSAVLVRQTATTGALIIRLYRNDDWIEEMLYWLHQFQTHYVEPQVPPPTNFFWEDDRYRAFVQRTNDLVVVNTDSHAVELLAHVEHKDIQRTLGTTHAESISLFLDELIDKNPKSSGV